MFTQIAPVHNKYDIEIYVKKLTEDDTTPPESPLLPPPTLSRSISRRSIVNQKIFSTLLTTLQEHQTIRTFAIFQKFLTLKLLLWPMEIFIFSSIQPI